jgi:hypothetical protein
VKALVYAEYSVGTLYGESRPLSFVAFTMANQQDPWSRHCRAPLEVSTRRENGQGLDTVLIPYYYGIRTPTRKSTFKMGKQGRLFCACCRLDPL